MGVKIWFREFFEGDRCRFKKDCELYRVDSATCNDLGKRKPFSGRFYCGKYRELRKNEGQ